MMEMDLLAEKKRENIASYVISFWHIEDLIRANQFDLEAIDKLMVAPMDADEETRLGVRTWYADLITRMREQGLEKSGHLDEVEEVLNELEYLHRSLIDVLHDEAYAALFKEAEPGILTLQKAADDEAEGPITTCFTAIYGVLLLRAQKRPISEATREAEEHIRRLLERLSQHYRQMRRLPGVSMN